MHRENPMENAGLLYAAVATIIVVISIIVIIEGLFDQGEISSLRTEQTLSNLEIKLLSSNDTEITLKITNEGSSVVNKEDLSFRFNEKEINPEIETNSHLRKGDTWTVKITHNKGKLEIFSEGNLIYNHDFS
ncbi:MAG: hypothetical protein U9N35_07045 [Euryarchaeota archaeon]|nr:hypothetical protein [Euryarchaeota archaeon]